MTALQKGTTAPIAKTHQEIVDGIERLHPQYIAIYKAAKAELDAQRDELQRQCGDIGHVFAQEKSIWGMYSASRVCLFCGGAEPKQEG